MKKSYAPHVTIIQEAIAAIEDYRPATKEEFLASNLVQDGILMRLQVIGEHLSRMRQIDDERFAEVADPSWYKIIGLRHIISHGYESIDWDLVWLFIHLQLADFATNLNRLTE